jgi:hypothetical protein
VQKENARGIFAWQICRECIANTLAKKRNQDITADMSYAPPVPDEQKKIILDEIMERIIGGESLIAICKR